MLTNIPPMMILLILRLRSCKTKVVSLGPEHAVRRDDDGFAILDAGLESLQPISGGPFEVVEIQDSFAREHT
jgi:hypothetical protein